MSGMDRNQIRALEVATRVSSVFSVLGSAFILFTFLRYPFFRKPINRLVFFATWGNIMSNVATLMSRTPIPKDPTILPPGLCEFQGVLIQWFMMADSLWVLSMATNVFLVFFHGYDAQHIRRLEKWYLIFAYGIPMIPALIYVILDHTGHRIIGGATIWCWVARDVDWMRITFFYAPVWLIITATLTIYIVTGLRIFKKRAELRSFSRQSREIPTATNLDAAEDTRSVRTSSISGAKNIIVTTQIKYDVQPDERRASEHTQCESHDGDNRSINSNTKILSTPKKVPDDAVSTIAPSVQLPHHGRGSGSCSSGHAQNGYRATAFAANSVGESPMLRRDSIHTGRNRGRVADGNAAAMAYLNVAYDSHDTWPVCSIASTTPQCLCLRPPLANHRPRARLTSLLQGTHSTSEMGAITPSQSRRSA